MANIFLWGCYWQGNFGDDLMAYNMYTALEKLGHKVTVFKLSRLLSDKYNIKSTNDVNTAVRECDYVILGGGAVFKGSIGLAKTILSSEARNIESEYNNLAKAVETYSKRVYCVSVGSDGINSINALSRNRKKIFMSKYFKGGTFRLEEDLEKFKGKFESCEYCPDILLTAFSDINENNNASNIEKTDKLRIGVNIGKKDVALYKELEKWAKSNTNVDLTYLITHNDISGIKYEYTSKEFKSLVINDPVEFTKNIANYDVIVSVKLHLGITALSAGVKFISYRPRPKTREQLSKLELDNCVFDKGCELRLVGLLNDLITSDNKIEKNMINVNTKPALLQVEKVCKMASNHNNA